MADTDIVLDQGSGAAPTPSTFRRRIILAVRILAALAIAYFIVATTVDQWAAVRSTFGRLSWTAILLSLPAALIGICAPVLAWREALADLGHRTKVAAAGEVFLVGQLGKYLPGSVWSYVMQMELGRRNGIRRSRVFLASLITTGLGITVGLVLGALALPSVRHASQVGPYPHTARIALFAALILLPIALVCAYPGLLNRLVGRLLRIMRREPLDTSLSWRGVLRTSAWAAVGYAGFGLHLWLLTRTQAAPGWAGLGQCIVAMSLAIAVSTVVVIAPSGIGVRELIIVITLGGFGVPMGTAIGLALASRLVATIADVTAAGAAAAVGVHQLRRTRSTASSS